MRREEGRREEKREEGRRRKEESRKTEKKRQDWSGTASLAGMRRGKPGRSMERVLPQPQSIPTKLETIN